MTAAACETRLERVRVDEPDRLEALLVGAGPHVEPVLDVGSTPSGDLLLVLPAPAARLTDLLQVPGWPTRGEAVTVLAPLAESLGRMHEAGVASGAAGAESVVIDASGAPAWRLPAAPLLARRAGPAAFAAAVAADRARFAELATAVVDRAGGRLPATTDLGELADALFGIAEPVPVRLRPEPPVPGSITPSRLVDPTPPGEAAARGRVALLVGALRKEVRRSGRAAATVRRRVWVAAGAVAGGLVAAVLLLPAGGAGATSGLEDHAATRAVPSAGASASLRPTTASAGPAAARTLDGATAVRRLLAARSACLDRGRASCLAAVDAPGSPVAAADLSAVRSGTAGIRAGGSRSRVLSAGGGTVVSAVGRVVVVAVRQQDGWRLRDVVAEAPG